MLRRTLDRLYQVSGGIAALAILAICLLVAAQVALNVLARLGGPSLSFTIPSYADFAGYALATASFMAMASTLRAGVHIRVNLVLQRLAVAWRWRLELAALAAGSAMAAFATYFSVGLLMESWEYGDTSPGIIPIPLWIPQSFMVAGLALLTVAFIDTLVESARAKAPILVDSGAE